MPLDVRFALLLLLLAPAAVLLDELAVHLLGLILC
jgi:hypothetical protein